MTLYHRNIISKEYATLLPCSSDLLLNKKQGTCNAVDSHLARADICNFERAGKRNWSSDIFVAFVLSCHEDILRKQCYWHFSKLYFKGHKNWPF